MKMSSGLFFREVKEELKYRFFFAKIIKPLFGQALFLILKVPKDTLENRVL